MSDQAPPNYPAPSGPVYPSAPGAASGGPVTAPPSQVNIAFWLYIVAAIISAATLLLTAVTIGATQNTLRAQLASRGQHVSTAEFNALIATSVTVAVVVGVLFLAAYVLFAIMMRRGANWARIVLLVLTVLSITGVTGAYGLGALRLALSIVATVLVFLRPANEYFAAVKARKAIR